MRDVRRPIARTFLVLGSAALGLGGLSLTLVGCPEETTNPPGDAGADSSSCTLEYIGDPDAAMELELTTLAPDYTAKPLAEGGDTSILIPPQGGRVIFVGLRAKNVDPCALSLNGALRDPATNAVSPVDGRYLNLDATEDGWGQSDATDISTYANIAVCANHWASTDVFDQPFQLELSVTDRTGKKGKALLNVVPRCDETKIQDGVDLQKECLCLCKEGYVTGEDCDAGP